MYCDHLDCSQYCLWENVFRISPSLKPCNHLKKIDWLVINTNFRFILARLKRKHILSIGPNEGNIFRKISFSKTTNKTFNTEKCNNFFFYHKLLLHLKGNIFLTQDPMEKCKEVYSQTAALIARTQTVHK